jgi:hypothetical protein
MDTLTPLDARNSLLLDRSKTINANKTSDSLSMTRAGGPTPEETYAAAIPPSGMRDRSPSPEQYLGHDTAYHPPPRSLSSSHSYQPLTPNTAQSGGMPSMSRENLAMNAAPIGGLDARQPTLPNLGGAGFPAYAPSGYRPVPSPAPQRGPYGQGGGYGNYGPRYGPPRPQRGGY